MARDGLACNAKDRGYIQKIRVACVTFMSGMDGTAGREWRAISSTTYQLPLHLGFSPRRGRTPRSKPRLSGDAYDHGCLLLYTTSEGGLYRVSRSHQNLFSANSNYRACLPGLMNNTLSLTRRRTRQPPIMPHATASPERTAYDGWKQISGCNNIRQGNVTSTRDPTENKRDIPLSQQRHVG